MSKARKRYRGLSLLEVLVVIAIMALIAGATGFALFNVQAKTKNDLAKQQAMQIRQAALHSLATTEGECPTIESLRHANILDEVGRSLDPWGGKWTITCTDQRVVVRSPGPDRTAGTPDDIVVPP